MDWLRSGSIEKSLKGVCAEGKRTNLHVSEALSEELAWTGREAVVNKSLIKRTHLHVSETMSEELFRLADRL
jgi:hypothetical protein